jgi:ornithine cyclodeaminase/alanine dehydrogenase-like protein (mu-crystallin family)
MESCLSTVKTCRLFGEDWEMIYLNEADILKAASIEEMLDVIETSMDIYEKKAFHMPQRLHIDREDNTLLLMPCFTGDYFGTKLVTLFPGNPAREVPVLNGIMVLNDAETGVPIALLNGPALTALRTAAVGAVSIRHLASDDTDAIGIIGAGVQGLYQAWFASSARPVRDIYIFDLHADKSAILGEKLSAKIPQVRVHQAARVEDLLEKAQVVITATDSQQPVLPDEEELLAGKHFVGIGSYKPNMREFPRALFKLLKTVFVDTEHALQESGDLIFPLQNDWIKQDQVMTLGRFLADHRSEDQLRRQTTLFKSVGMALFDVCASGFIYESAMRKGLGQKIHL